MSTNEENFEKLFKEVLEGFKENDDSVGEDTVAPESPVENETIDYSSDFEGYSEAEFEAKLFEDAPEDDLGTDPRLQVDEDFDEVDETFEVTDDSDSNNEDFNNEDSNFEEKEVADDEAVVDEPELEMSVEPDVAPKRGYIPEDEDFENDDYGFEVDDNSTPSTPQRSIGEDEEVEISEDGIITEVSEKVDEVSDNDETVDVEGDTIIPAPIITTTTVETNVDDSDKPKKKKKNVALIVVLTSLLLVLALAAAYFGYKYYDEQQHTIVPEASASLKSEADISEVCEIFIASELDCESSFGLTDEVARDTLINQSIAPGERVTKDTMVQLLYSIGPASSKFPNLYNKPLSVAEEMLYEINISISAVNEVDGGGLPQGNIVSASVEPDTLLENGVSVVLNVSNGRVTIPDWVGKTREQVEADSDALGVDVIYVEEESAQPSGIVLSQTPVAGEIGTTDEISVTISKAVEIVEIIVPDVIGKTAEEAQVDLAIVGFTHISTVNIENTAVTESQVTQIVPNVGTSTSSETNIVIIVSDPIS